MDKTKELWVVVKSNGSPISILTDSDDAYNFLEKSLRNCGSVENVIVPEWDYDNFKITISNIKQYMK